MPITDLTKYVSQQDPLILAACGFAAVLVLTAVGRTGWLLVKHQSKLMRQESGSYTGQSVRRSLREAD